MAGCTVVSTPSSTSRSPAGWACWTMLDADSMTAVVNVIWSMSLTNGTSSQRLSRSLWTASMASSAAGPRKLREARTSVIAERLLGRGVGGEDLVHAGQLQDHVHLRLYGSDPQVPAGLAGGLQAADQRAEARGVHERRVFQVDHDPVGPARDHVRHELAQLGRGDHVQPPVRL